MPNDVEEIKEATYEAEASLLGSILLMSATRSTLNEVKEILKISDFKYTLYANIFSAMISADGPPNQIIVARELSRVDRLGKGYCAELSELVAKCPCALDYLHYAKVVKQYSNDRCGKIKPIFKGGV